MLPIDISLSPYSVHSPGLGLEGDGAPEESRRPAWPRLEVPSEVRTLPCGPATQPRLGPSQSWKPHATASLLSVKHRSCWTALPPSLSEAPAGGAKTRGFQVRATELEPLIGTCGGKTRLQGLLTSFPEPRAKRLGLQILWGQGLLPWDSGPGWGRSHLLQLGVKLTASII